VSAVSDDDDVIGDIVGDGAPVVDVVVEFVRLADARAPDRRPRAPVVRRGVEKLLARWMKTASQVFGVIEASGIRTGVYRGE